MTTTTKAKAAPRKRSTTSTVGAKRKSKTASKEVKGPASVTTSNITSAPPSAPTMTDRDMASATPRPKPEEAASIPIDKVPYPESTEPPGKAVPPPPAEPELPQLRPLPPPRKQFVREIFVERKAKMVPKEKPPKEPKQPRAKKGPRDKFFSEAHPHAFAVASRIMPMLHTFIIVMVIIAAASFEMVKGNMMFMYDWFQATVIGPVIVTWLTVPGAFQIWWQDYGIVTIVICSLIVFCLILFYVTFWRMAFKDYWKFSEGGRRFEGRCYWRTNNGWTQRWDRLYRSPPRTVHTYWLKQSWLPLFNIFIPASTLIRLDTTSKEKCSLKGLMGIVVEERPIRRKVNNDSRHLTTIDDSYHTTKAPNDYAKGHFDHLSEILVDDTKNLSFGNAENRNTIMKDGLRLTSEKFRRHIIDTRKPDQQ